MRKMEWVNESERERERNVRLISNYCSYPNGYLTWNGRNCTDQCDCSFCSYSSSFFPLHFVLVMKIQQPYNRNRMRNKYIALQIQWGQQTQKKKQNYYCKSQQIYTREKIKQNRTKPNRTKQSGMQSDERKEWRVESKREEKKRATSHTIDIIVKPWADSTFTNQWRSAECGIEVERTQQQKSQRKTL